jgi:ABC-type multidrug transport system fused ATPase/permease subunit
MSLLRLLMARRSLLLSLVIVALLLVAVESLGLGSVLVLLGGGESTGVSIGASWWGELLQRIGALGAVVRIRIAAVALVGMAVLRGALQYMQRLLALRLRRTVARDLQEQVFRHFYDLPLEAFQREQLGGLTTLLRQYTQQVGELVLQIGQAAANSVLLLAYSALAFWLSWRLALLSLALLLPVGLLLRPLIGTRLRVASRQTRDLMKALQSMLQEHLTAMKLIRLFGQEAWSQKIFEQAVELFQQKQYRAAALASLVNPLFSLLNALMLAAVLVAGSFLLSGPPETLIAQLALFLVIAFRLTGPLGGLASVQTQMTQAAPMLQSILDLLETDGPTAPHGGTIPYAGLSQGVSLEAVTFRYAQEELPVLQDLTLYIPHGQMTAVVGASGAGKSTLVNLLARLYDPDEGRVCVDGVDLRELEITSWRQRIAVVSQEVVLFHTDVWENLRFARADASEAEIIRACQLAQAHEFITALPAGYATLLQEQGVRLSGGQRQRIALARALLRDPDLLILDEATSEVDTLTEQAIQAALDAYRRGRTLLVIAHRLSTVARADCIYVLDAGRVVEQGSHADLLAQRGVYWQLVQAQALTDEPG